MSGNDTNSTSHNWDRLPPPAFPRGRRRWRPPAPPPEVRPSTERTEPLEPKLPDPLVDLPADEAAEDRTVEPDSVADPESPIVPTEDPLLPEDLEAVVGRIMPMGVFSAEDVQDGGTENEAAGPDLYVDPWEDPHLTALVALVRRLSEELQTRGEAALESEPEMSTFETTLRAYCVGYLEGLRQLDL